MGSKLTLFITLVVLLPSASAVNFSIRTDRTNYFDNDTIKVYILPDNLVASITYADKTLTSSNQVEFKAVLYENTISARIGDQEQKALINVNKRDDFYTLYQLCVLFILIYIIYKIARHYALKVGSHT